MDCDELYTESFGGTADVRAQAPGRIEFIGNHTDYNGGCVLGAAIDRKLCVAAGLRSDRSIYLKSGASGPVVASSVDDSQSPEPWARYPLAVFAVMREAGMKVSHGFNFALAGDLPAGAGLSSSAALELATAFALNRLYGAEFDRDALVRLCRQAENERIGVPCGILDQGVCGHGRAGHLVGIDCLDERISLLPVPEDWGLWVFNSGVKHSLVDSLYSQRHAECAGAFRQLQAQGVAAPCLARVPLAALEANGGKLDEVLFNRARHVIEENLRVGQVTEALSRGNFDLVGQLLFQSHESSRKRFENSCPELDWLVDALRIKPGVRGARLSGGGFGGAVMALTGPDFSETDAVAVCEGFKQRFATAPSFFRTAIGKGADVFSI